MCGRSSSSRRLSSCRWLLLAVALISGIVSAAAQDTPPAATTSELSETVPPLISPPSMTSKWDDLEERLETLSAEANLSSMDWDELLTELARVRAEVEKLRLDSERSSMSFEAYEQRTSERIASIEARAEAEAARALRAERSRDAWRTGALVAGGLVLIESIVLAVSLAN